MANILPYVSFYRPRWRVLRYRELTKRGSFTFLKNIAIWAAAVAVTGLSSSFALAAAGAYFADFQPEVSDVGMIVAAGPAGSFFYQERSSALYQLDSTGHRITTFTSPPGYYSAAVRDSTGAIFAAGGFSIGGKATGIVKLRPDGTPVPDFQPHTTEYFPPQSDYVSSGITCLAPDGMGGCYVGGNFTSIDGKGVANVTLFHLNQLGRLTTVTAPGEPSVMARTSNGLFLGCGNSLWLLPDSGVPVKIVPPTARREWDRIYLLAFDSKFGLAVIANVPNAFAQCFVYRADGSLNSSFQQAVDFSVLTYALGWDDAGRLLVSTWLLPIDEFHRNPTRGLKRLLQDGRLDPTWSQTLDFDDPPRSLAMLSDGTIAVGGVFQRLNGQPRKWLARLTGDAQPSQRLNRHSARALITGGSQPLIVGFTIEGNTSVDVLVRGVGASLRQFGVARTPATTLVSIYRGTERLAAASEYVTQAARLVGESMGLFPSSPNAREAMLLVSLPPGTYTAVVDAPEGDGGEVLCEVCYP